MTLGFPVRRFVCRDGGGGDAALLRRCEIAVERFLSAAARAGRQNSRICIYAVGRTDIAFFILALLPYNRTVFFPP